MAEQFKQQSRINLDSTVAYTDADLKQAFESFVQEEPKQGGQSLINFPTIAGFGMFLVAFAYVIGQIIPGVNTASDLTNWLEALPIIGGFLVTFIGLGWFSRNRKKKSKKKEFNADFLNSSSSKTADAKFAFNSSASFTSEKSRADAQTKSDFESAYYDAYALKKSKKLFRSITDKKVSGVCGGLAKYLGVSSTFLRLVFIIATFMGYGSPVLVYFILSFLLPKEPKLIIE